jgi:SAM-dependent methyltransferase
MRILPSAFTGSQNYWEQRYASGGNSGAGSYGRLCEFKADVINAFVETHQIGSVVEFGCGDGHQLTLARYPAYLGVDVSATAVQTCRDLFGADESKRFCLLDDYAGQSADLALSLDVIFHLVEDTVYEAYMDTLFKAADRYVIVYSSAEEGRQHTLSMHVRHRKFDDWVSRNAPRWKLIERIPNKFHGSGNGSESSFSDFYIYSDCQKYPEIET